MIPANHPTEPIGIEVNTQLLKAIVESSNDAIIAKTLDGTILSWNRAAEEMYGYMADEVIGKSINTIFPEDGSTELRTILAKIKQGEKVVHRDTKRTRKDGSKIDVSVTVSPVTGPDGKIVGASAIARDITQRKREEKELRISRIRLSQAADLAHLVYWGYDVDSGLFTFNDAFYNFHGTTAEHEGGYQMSVEKFAGELVESKSAQNVSQQIERALNSLDPAYTSQIHAQICRRDGSIRDAIVTIATVRDASGKIIKIVGTQQDVTELKQTEKKLRILTEDLEGRVRERTQELELARRAAVSMMQDAENQRRDAEDARKNLEESTRSLRLMSRAIEASPVSVAILDKQSRIEYVNTFFLTTTGYSADEILGQGLDFFRSDENSAFSYSDMLENIMNGKVWSGELPSKKKSGETFWESVIVAPVDQTTEQFKGFIAVKTDITERKRFVEELEQAKLQAEEANRAKSAFLSNMSHEIRTPMNAILGFSQLMTYDANLVPEQKRLLDIVVRNGENLLSLINDILEMSKIEAGRTTIKLSDFDLYDLMTNVDALFRQKVEMKGLRLEVNIDESTPRYVVADESKVRQILTNLIDNAIKFTYRGKISLQVTADHKEDDNVRLKMIIEDSGVGINGQQLAGLFQPFQQTETGAKMGGTGLGLALSRKFARLMGGDITVISHPDSGSRFQVEIEVKKTERSHLSPIRTHRRVVGLEPGQGPYRVLIVDDKAEMRILLNRFLSPVGFETMEAVNGSEAVARFHEWAPHLILMDIRMPVMGGYDAIKAIKSSPSGAKTIILVVTASVLDFERRKGMETGADGYLNKPFKGHELFEALGAHLGIRYIYEEEPQEVSHPEIVGAEEPSVMSLDEIPYETRERMLAATASLDLDLLMDLIDQIPERLSETADKLRQMAGAYEFERLLELLRRKG